MLSFTMPALTQQRPVPRAVYTLPMAKRARHRALLPRLRLLPAALATLCWLAPGAAARAQTAVLPDLGPDPASVMQDHLQRLNSARPRSTPPALETAPMPRGLAPGTTASITVSEIQFSRTELLTQAELGQIGQRYVGRALTASDIQRLLDDISELYRARGVLTAVPVLPQQNLHSGLLRVLLVEGKLGKVQVHNAGRVNSDWVRQWFDLQNGSVVTNEQLREKLARFNANSDLTAKAEFVPGTRFGVSDLAVTLQDAPRLQSWAMFEATRTETGAPAQLSVGLRLAPFSPVGGRADAAFLTSANSRTFMASASIPDGFLGWRAGLTGSVSETRASVSATDGQPDLRVTGRSSSASLDISRQWILTGPWTLGTTFSVGTIRSSTRVDGLELLNRRTDRYALTSTLHHDGDRTQAALRAGLVFGDEAAGRYSYLDAGGSVLTPIDPPAHWRMRLNGMVRWRGHNSPSASDRFQLGGNDSVRGYDAASIAGDAGAAVQMELRYRPAPADAFTPEGYAFVDIGHTRSPDGDLNIRSAGLGLQARINPNLGVELLGSRQLRSPLGPRTRLSLRAILGW